MQSCLEIKGIEERNKEIIKNDYNNSDITHNYSRSHKDANSDGDNIGRGSKNITEHISWKPHYYNSYDKSTKNIIKYDNFDTRDENIGTCYDINGKNNIGGRKKSQIYSLYNSSYQYGRDIIGTQIKI